MRRMYSLNQLEEIANARVKALVEGGTLDNAKPIFCHPISLINTTNADYKFSINLLIFDNQEEAYTATTFIEKLKENDAVSWATTGAYKSTIEGSPYFSPSAIRYASNKLVLYGLDSGGLFHSASQNTIDVEVIVNATGTVLLDAPNKIN